MFSIEHFFPIEFTWIIYNLGKNNIIENSKNNKLKKKNNNNWIQTLCIKLYYDLYAFNILYYYYLYSKSIGGLVCFVSYVWSVWITHSNNLHPNICLILVWLIITRPRHSEQTNRGLNRHESQMKNSDRDGNNF